MEILGRNNKDFDAIARSILGEAGADEKSITKSVLDRAQTLKLLPEETKRLVEATNLAMALSVLNGQGDKKRGFPLVQKDEVLSKLHADPDKKDQQEKTAENIGSMSFAYEHRISSTQDVSLFTKQAGHVETECFKPAPNADQLFKLALDKQVARRTVLATKECVASCYDELLSIFSQAKSPSFEKFACDMTTLHGDGGTKICKALAVDLRIVYPGIIEKTAGVVDDLTREMTVAKDLIAGLGKYAEAHRNLANADTALSLHRKQQDSKLSEAFGVKVGI
jgi:hypothetical protein